MIFHCQPVDIFVVFTNTSDLQIELVNLGAQMQKIMRVSLVVCLCCLTMVIPMVHGRLTSVFYGSQGWNMDEVRNFQYWLGKNQSVVVLFTDWCDGNSYNLFNHQIPNIWNTGHIPLITWEMKPCGSATVTDITVRIGRNGEFDAYIWSFGNQLKKWLSGPDGIYGNGDDRRVYLRPGHEMNGNWYPWSAAMGGSTPNDYIHAFQHTHNLMVNSMGLDLNHVQWVWCVNNADVGGFRAEEYWPGDQFVDWIGIDGYNFGTSQSWSTWVWPNQIFDEMFARVRALAPYKPLSINEYGSSTKSPWYNPDIDSKTNWLRKMCDYIKDHNVKMASYFNIEKETDWSVFGGANGNALWNNMKVYTAYRDCLYTIDWIAPDSQNPRLITDSQFTGK